MNTSVLASFDTETFTATPASNRDRHVQPEDFRAAYIRGMSDALASLLCKLEGKLPVYIDGDTNNARPSYQAFMEDTHVARRTPAGDEHFQAAFFSVRGVFAQVRAVKQELLTAEEYAHKA